MKQIISILFISLILTQATFRVLVVISYQVNHDFIVKYLCEKRDEPKNECDGKCWLKKELNKTEEENNNQLPPSKTEIPGDNFICQGDECKMKEFLAEGSFSYGYYQNQFLTSGIIADIFHPPKLKSL